MTMQVAKVYEDPQAGRDLRQRLLESGAAAHEHQGVHRTVLQSVPLALGARLPIAGRVRATTSVPANCRRRDDEFFQAWGGLSTRWCRCKHEERPADRSP